MGPGIQINQRHNSSRIQTAAVGAGIQIFLYISRADGVGPRDTVAVGVRENRHIITAAVESSDIPIFIQAYSSRGQIYRYLFKDTVLVGARYTDIFSKIQC